MQGAGIGGLGGAPLMGLQEMVPEGYGRSALGGIVALASLGGAMLGGFMGAADMPPSCQGGGDKDKDKDDDAS